MRPRSKNWNRKWLRKRLPRTLSLVPRSPKIGLALGGGFARGVAHVGVLNVLEREKIPLHCITGVSAGAVVAAAFASGATTAEIAAAAGSMRFGHVASWGFSKLGLAGSEKMTTFLRRLLKHMQFDDMQIPLGVVATDLSTGEAVEFRDHGDVAPAIRASCSYPALFRPVELNGRTLIDGGISVEVPSKLARSMGATHVISVCLPSQEGRTFSPGNMFDVLSRAFQIMMAHNEGSWRNDSDIVLTPEVGGINWDGFVNAKRMIEAGERAAMAALPQIRRWMGKSAARFDPELEVEPETAPALSTATESSRQFEPVRSPAVRLSCPA